MSVVERARRRVRKARNLPPGARLAHAVEPLFRRLPDAFVWTLARRLGLPEREVLGHFHAARTGPLTRRLLEIDAPNVASGAVGLVPGALLYALVRTVRPALMIETGVASGASSTFILGAMHDNGHGRLISIDLPFTDEGGEPAAVLPGTSISKAQWSPVPRGREHGWLVPDEFRDRWDLRAGDARELLPVALAEVGELDVFLHDSLHTLEHMLFEYEAAWPHLRPGGLLLTDDLGRKGVDPLQRFSRTVGVPFYAVGSMGYMRKPVTT